MIVNLFHMLPPMEYYIPEVRQSDATMRNKQPRKHAQSTIFTTNSSPMYVGVGRNELCPCGSSMKFKKCCINKTKH